MLRFALTREHFADFEKAFGTDPQGNPAALKKRKDTGEIIVALVDNEEATLKRLRRRGDSIALEAANPAYETRLYGSDRVKVQGKLVGLIRRY